MATSYSGQGFASTSSSTSEIPTHRPSGEAIPTSEQLMQVDQAITLTLQDIDANFAKCHQIITGKILPSIRQYGIASHNTWQGAKFWHKFFETASDINLVPTYEGEEQTEASTQETSTSLQIQGDDSTYISGSPYSISRHQQQTHFGDGEDFSEIGKDEKSREIESSGEIYERDLEPPKLSDASRAATERHGKKADPSWAPVESPYEKLKRDVENDFRLATNQEADTSMDRETGRGYRPGQSNSTTPKAPKGSKLSTNFVRQQHGQLLRSLQKVQATPKQGNPFTSGKVHNSIRNANHNRWNGIADLRKTPLAKVKGIPKTARHNFIGDESMESLPLPLGMSPPVTMQFSRPEKKYDKTPAKVAANQAVNDLLYSIEVASPATRRKLLETHLKDSATSSGSKLPKFSNLTSTPLRKSIQKGRKSLPTPPTVTKRMERSELSRGAQRADSPAGISSAKLFDEDEAGGELRDDDNHEVPPGLGTKLGNMTLLQLAGSIDQLLEVHIDDEEDSSGEEDDSDSDEEEEIGRAQSTTLQSALKRNGIGTDYPTGSSLASVSRSIDQDTLFGIRDPKKVNLTGDVMTVQNRSKLSSQSQIANSSSAMNKKVQGSYQPMGARLYEQGTVYNGRPLLGDDREDTYSAPSPSPAIAMAAVSKKSK